jgi:hypothetical protein
MQQETTAEIPASTDTEVPALQRERLVALIRENVNQLAADGDSWGLDVTLDAVGFHSCIVDDDDCEKLAAAIGALVPLLNDDMLGFVANNAVFYRWRESRGLDAYAIARAAVEPLGVKFAPCGCFAAIRGSAAECAHCGSMASAS